jgi:hypothetical protein
MVRSPARYAVLALIPLAGIAVVSSFVPPGILWGDEPNGYDVLEYHLELPREWYQTHSTSPVTNNVFSNFPLLAESHYLLAMQLKGGPWAGMYLAQLMHAAFFVLAALSVYGAVREENEAAAIPATVAFASTPWIALLAPVAYNEGPLVLFSTLAVVLVMRGLREEGPRWVFVLAGMFAGFACGTKLTAVPMVVMALPVVLLASRIISKIEVRNPRRVGLKKDIRDGEGSGSNFRFQISDLAGFVVGAAITFSPWLLRTHLATGNPVFPELTKLFGSAHFTMEQITRWHVANHLPAQALRSVGGRVSELFEQIILDPRYGYTLIPLAILCIVLARASSLHRSAAVLLLAIHLLLLTIFWLFFTHLQSRFYILAVPISALLVGQLRSRRAIQVASVVVAVQVVISTVYLFQRYGDRVTRVLPAAGVEDLQLFLPKEIAESIDAARPLALVGDSKAFMYQRPIQMLHYRTVFDVRVKAGQDIISGWLEGAPADPTVVVDPVELDRFSRTYFGVVPMAADPALPRDRMFILRR